MTTITATGLVAQGEAITSQGKTEAITIQGKTHVSSHLVIKHANNKLQVTKDEELSGPI